MKKVISLFIALMLLAFCVFPLTAFAETTEPSYIYFQIPTAPGVAWKNFSMVYCHIWENGGDAFFAWQGKDERCEDLENGYWRYDISGFDFNPESSYAVIFSNENALQTYDLTFTSACKGDYVYCNGDTCTNPVDSEQQCTVARWAENGDDVHPVSQLGSDGVQVNPDMIVPENIDLTFGASEGVSVELPEVAVSDDTDEDAADDNADADADIDAVDDDVMLISENPASSSSSLTIWIIVICAAVVVAVIILVVILAIRNKKKSA